MNIDGNSESTICMGCLSVDRKLQLLNEECKQTLCGLLEVFVSSLLITCVKYNMKLRLKSL